MSFKKGIAYALIAVVMLMSFSSCSQQSTPTENTSEISTKQSLVLSDSIFSQSDRVTDFDTSESVSITLADGGSSASVSSVSVSNDTVTITAEGTYILSGNLSDGGIIIDSTKESKIHLIFNSVNISSSSTAPVYIRQADKVFITLNEGTQNTLCVNGEYKNNGEDNIDSAIFSKDDLTINGNGNLSINTAYGHGIVSKDDLNITGGSYYINSASHGITGKDRVCISDSTMTVVSGKDCIHAENAEDTTLGYLYIESGSFDLTSDGDGLSASAYAQIENGTFNIKAGGSSKNGETHQNDMFGGFQYQTESTDDTTSAKGIKSASTLQINGGDFNIDSADDAVHSNADIYIQGGNFTIETGDDGFHADKNTRIDAGVIAIKESYEGIEGQSIDINGGSITLKASDDGLNAAGGNDESGMSGFGGRNDVFANDTNAYIKICGGRIIADADGDGVDSNGSIYIQGGETYVAGPTNGGNGSLDYGGEAIASGGTFIASGAQGMAANFSTSSTQGAAMVNINSTQTGAIEIMSADGTLLANFTPNKAYNNIVFTCPGMNKGNIYKINCGTASAEITLTDTVYGQSGGMGGNMHGGMGGGMPDRKPRW